MYLILLQRIRTSPRNPIYSFLVHSSELVNLIFKYESDETKIPLYSIPHFSFIRTRLPSKDFRYFFGLIVELYGILLILKFIF